MSKDKDKKHAPETHHKVKKPHTVGEAVNTAIKQDNTWQAAIKAGKTTAQQIKNIVVESLQK